MVNSVPSRRAFNSQLGLSALALSAAGLAGACGGPANDGKPSERLRLRLATDWRAQAEHGGFYQALADSLYKDVGLDVEIIQGGPSSNVPQLLAAGAVELGMVSNLSQVLAMVDADSGCKAIMAGLQQDPQVLMCHPRDDISSIADMAGKPIMISDAAITAYWPWLRAKYGFTDAMVRKYTFNSAPFIANQNAIQQGYLTSESFTIKAEAGFEPETYLLSAAGYPSFAAIIMASQRLIDEHFDALTLFVAASCEGWRRFIAEDGAAGSAAIMKDNPQMAPALLAFARKELKERHMVIPQDGTKIGHLNETRLKEFTKIMTDAHVYPANIDWHKGVDLRFNDL